MIQHFHHHHKHILCRNVIPPSPFEFQTKWHRRKFTMLKFIIKQERFYKKYKLLNTVKSLKKISLKFITVVNYISMQFHWSILKLYRTFEYSDQCWLTKHYYFFIHTPTLLVKYSGVLWLKWQIFGTDPVLVVVNAITLIEFWKQPTNRPKYKFSMLLTLI